LRRDPTHPDHEQSWIVHYRWQWRFWRGPYRDAGRAMAKKYGWKNWRDPSWWSTLRSPW
jgi:hypothetical protein